MTWLDTLRQLAAKATPGKRTADPTNLSIAFEGGGGINLTRYEGAGGIHADLGLMAACTPERIAALVAVAADEGCMCDEIYDGPETHDPRRKECALGTALVRLKETP